MLCGHWHDAIEAVDHMLDLGFGLIPIAKALDPTNADDFVTMTNKLRRRFHSIVGPVERDAVAAAVNDLDVDWVGMTDTQRVRVVESINLSLRGIPEQVLPTLTIELEGALTSTIEGTKEALNDRYQLGINLSTDLVDERVAQHAASSQATYVRDVYGSRRAEFSSTARRTISEGLERGLRSPEIADRLGAAARRIHLERSQNYWQVVSSASMNRSRIYAQLRGFDEAQISTWMFEAVLDQRTTDICRHMHGKVWPVRPALDRMNRIANGVEEVKQASPWVRRRRLPDGRIELYVRQEGVGDSRIAIVERSGVGSLDDVGSYSESRAEAHLSALGVDVPPLHGLCRSTIIPA